jgi:hypothetical protein
MNPRFERQVQPIGMLRWSSTAAMGKLHCGIASAWQSRLRIDAVEKVEIWECPFFLPRGQLSENPRWICYHALSADSTFVCIQRLSEPGLECGGQPTFSAERRQGGGERT